MRNGIAQREHASETPLTAPAMARPGRAPARPGGIHRRAATSPSAPPAPAHWRLEELAGRLCELSGIGASAQLTLAFALVAEAQQRKEPVVWITSRQSTFFPPDAAANGVDLPALPVIFVPDAPAAGRAASRLARSGAFGLIVLDLVGMKPPRSVRYAGSVSVDVPLPLQSRLVGLAQKHDSAVVCLTEKPADVPSLGTLVSLRCEAKRENDGQGRFLCRAQAIKDKRRGPGWSHAEVRRGPVGLC